MGGGGGGEQSPRNTDQVSNGTLAVLPRFCSRFMESSGCHNSGKHIVQSLIVSLLIDVSALDLGHTVGPDFFFFFFLRGVLRNMLIHSLGLTSHKRSMFLPPFGKFPYSCHFLWGPGEPRVTERVTACEVSWRHKELATSSYTFGVYKAHLLWASKHEVDCNLFGGISTPPHLPIRAVYKSYCNRQNTINMTFFKPICREPGRQRPEASPHEAQGISPGGESSI